MYAFAHKVPPRALKEKISTPPSLKKEKKG